eukprot:g3030.t1
MKEYKRREFELKPRTELRFQLVHDENKYHIKMILLKGTAEIFGSELIAGKEYVLSERNGAVFTWHGCNLLVQSVDVEILNRPVLDIFEKTNMDDVLREHGNLENLRKDALDFGLVGPRVAIVGAPHAGKSTFAEMLLAYAVKRGYQPMYVELDPAMSLASCQGTISASLATEFSLNPARGFQPQHPLVYFYGHTDTSVNKEAYKTLVGEMWTSVCERMEKHSKSDKMKASGAIVNMCSWKGEWTGKEGFELLTSMLRKKMAIDRVIVVDHDGLVNMIKSAFPDLEDSVVSVKASPGVSRRRPASIRDHLFEMQIDRYFYGHEDDLMGKCKPLSISKRFDEIEVYAIDRMNKIDNYMLPVGKEDAANQFQLKRVDVKDVMSLKHKLLAVMRTTDRNDVMDLSACVAGLVIVTNVEETFDGGGGEEENEEKKIVRLTITTPNASELPGNIFIVGSIRSMD